MTLMNSIIFGLGLSFIMPIIDNVVYDGSGLGEVTGYFIFFKDILHSVVPGKDDQKIFSLIAMSAIFSLNELIGFAVHYVNTGFTANVTIDCRNLLYRAIQNMSYVEFQINNRANYIQLLVTEVKHIYNLFKHGFKFLETCLNCFVCLVLLIIISKVLTFILFAGLFFVMACNVLISRKVKQEAKKTLSKRFLLMDAVSECVNGFKQVRLFGAEKLIEAQFNKRSMGLEKQARNSQIIIAIQPMVTQLLGTCVFLIIAILAFFSDGYIHNLPLKTGLITFLIVMLRMAMSISGMSQSYSNIVSSLPSVNKIIQFMNKLNKKRYKIGLCPEPLFAEKISFISTSFSFDDGTKIIDELDISIHKGDYLGVMGPSGIGKSTFLNLLIGLLQIDKGKIFYDNIDINELDKKYINAKVSFLSQDFFIFNTTIRDNLLISNPNASEQQLWDSLKRAGLGEFVMSLEKKLDTELGNNGERLSGGQRQRIGLATIFLRNSDLIILDEGLNSVDKDTEEHILSSLRDLNRLGKTIISSSHKQSSLNDTNKIFYFQNKTLKIVCDNSMSLT